jgi:hypothetical protein
LLGVIPNRRSKAEVLGRLRDEGVFLIDVADGPAGAFDLKAHIPGMLAGCHHFAPDALVLIKVTMFDAAYEPLLRAGLPVINCRIPFPGSGQQRCFEEQFAIALHLAGWGTPADNGRPLPSGNSLVLAA